NLDRDVSGRSISRGHATDGHLVSSTPARNRTRCVVRRARSRLCCTAPSPWFWTTPMARGVDLCCHLRGTWRLHRAHRLSSRTARRAGPSTASARLRDRNVQRAWTPACQPRVFRTYVGAVRAVDVATDVFAGYQTC